MAELYVKGWFQTAIARELAISQPTVCQDLQAIRKQWRESAIRDFDAARELELQKLNRVEREAWAAWERSQQPAQSAVMSGDGVGQHTRKAMHSQHGETWACVPGYEGLYEVSSYGRVRRSSKSRMASASTFFGNFLGGARLTRPRTATKLNFVALPLWGPGGHDKGKDPVNRNAISYQLGRSFYEQELNLACYRRLRVSCGARGCDERRANHPHAR